MFPVLTHPLRLLATGRSNGQIALALFVSPRTVKRHIANAYVKGLKSSLAGFGIRPVT